MYNRERRYDDALRMLQELRRLHPRNRLVVLEAGSTALRGGHAAQAEALLTEGLAMLASDRRREDPGEEALWRYKRGAARVALGRLDAAAQDLQAAIAPDDAAGWVQGTGAGRTRRASRSAGATGPRRRHRRVRRRRSASRAGSRLRRGCPRRC